MITHEELLDLLDYDKETGIFRWKKANNRKIKVGSVAGSKCKDGLIQVHINQKKYQTNRLAWFYVHKKWPMGQIMHINNIKADNRICNLKDVAFNSNRYKENIKPYHKKRYNKWMAAVTLYGKHMHIGTFNTEQEANQALINYRIEMENQGII